MLATENTDFDRAEVLSEAVLNAGKALGLKQADIAKIVGRSRSTLNNGINPDSLSGKMALYLVRIYRSLYALVSGDKKELFLWMHSQNTGTGGIPAEQIQDPAGMVRVMEYLDAMRGKV